MKYTIVSLLFVAGLASAHPGHDHSSWTAPLLHALWVTPVIVASLLAAHFLFKKISK